MITANTKATTPPTTTGPAPLRALERRPDRRSRPAQPTAPRGRKTNTKNGEPEREQRSRPTAPRAPPRRADRRRRSSARASWSPWKATLSARQADETCASMRAPADRRDGAMRLARLRVTASAASTAAGRNGSERRRAPVASKTALAIADGIAEVVGSPAPHGTRSAGRSGRWRPAGTFGKVRIG